MDIKKGDRLLGLYDVTGDPVTAGGSALIWKVHHIKWGIDMALKQPKQVVTGNREYYESFEHECMLWASLGMNPNIVTCYYVRRIGGIPMIFSEWCGGGSLADAIENGALDRERIPGIAADIMKGLCYAHNCRHKVVHKDIKPRNIMLTEDGTAKITDFGSTAVTSYPTTERYMSPEHKAIVCGIADSFTALTPASDIFSWAVTVLEMYLGKDTWKNGSNVRRILSRLPDTAGIPDAMLKLIKACLSLDPADRPGEDLILEKLGEITGDPDIGRAVRDSLFEPADSLNNRALSLLDLGLAGEAAKCWNEALRVFPRHDLSLYNYALFRWKNGLIDDTDLNTVLTDISGGSKAVSRQKKLIDASGKCLFSYEVSEDLNCAPDTLAGDPDATYSLPALRLGRKDGRIVLYIMFGSGIHRICDIEDKTTICEFGSDEAEEMTAGIEWGPEGIPASAEFLRDDGGEAVKRSYDAFVYESGGIRVYAFPDKYSPFTPLHLRIEKTDGDHVREYRFFGADDQVSIVTDTEKERVIAAFSYLCGDQISVVSFSLKDTGEYQFGKAERSEDLKKYTEKYADMREKLLGTGTFSSKARIVSRMMLFPDIGKRREILALRRVLFPKCRAAEPQVAEAVWYEHLAGADGVALSYSGRYAAVITNIDYSPVGQHICITDLYMNSSSFVCPEKDVMINSAVFINGNVLAVKYITVEALMFSEPEDEEAPTYLRLYDPDSQVWSDPVRVNSGLSVGTGESSGFEELDRFAAERGYNSYAVDGYRQFMAAIKHNGEFTVYSLYSVLVGGSSEQVSGIFRKKLEDILNGQEEKDCGHSKEQLDEELKALLSSKKRRRSREKTGDGAVEAALAAIFDAKPDDSPDLPDDEEVKQRKRSLGETARRISELRHELHKCIKGQDHSVDEFCDGLFNAYVSPDSDSSRKRPRAIFTFAGAPGCGKTFMAKTAARILFGKEPLFFSMTDYSAQQSHEGLIGIASFYKNSQPGKLTMAVINDPVNILVIDEVEKAHPNVIMMFYQMLDEGRLTDACLSGNINESSNLSRELVELAERTGGEASFEDTIIIFTTNVGRELYDSPSAVNCSFIPRQTVIKALGSETDPLSGSAYFPAAFVSRLATGYPILFNKLSPEALISVARSGFEESARRIRERWDIGVSADNDVFAALLYSEGGRVDARRFSAKVNRLIPENLRVVLAGTDPCDITGIRFRLDTRGASPQVTALFEADKAVSRVLVYSDRELFKKLRAAAGDSLELLHSDSVSGVLELAGRADIDFALIDVSKKSSDADDTDGSVTVAGRTVLDSPSARKWRFGKRLFEELAESCPWMPLYLLEPCGMKYGEELKAGFVTLGAHGTVSEPDSEAGTETLSRALADIRKETYMIAQAERLASTNKALAYDCSPERSDDGITVNVGRLRLVAAPPAEDMSVSVSAAERPTDRIDDVIGLDGAKKELRGVIRYLKDPKGYAAKGYPVPKGVLLYGAPGTGKTMLARAVAGECGVTFIAKSSGELISSYQGKGAENIRSMFESARRNAPAVIFIDEVDSIAAQRSASSNNEILNELLAQMDGFRVDLRHPVILIAATNYGIKAGDGGIGIIDEALRRRFSRCIKVELPDLAARKEIFAVMLGKIMGCTVTEAGIASAAEHTAGSSPAIIRKIIERAQWNALDGDTALDDAVLDEAMQLELHGDVREWDRRETKAAAVHECGHTLIYYLNNGIVPAYITAVSRGDFGGYMLPSEETRKKACYSGAELRAKVRELLGGRAAETVFFGEEEGITTGASNDLERATDIVRAYVMRYGMDSGTGIAVHETETRRITKRVNEILAEEMKQAAELIELHRSDVEKLSEELLKNGYLNATGIAAVLGK